jgi:protein KRI1
VQAYASGRVDDGGDDIDDDWDEHLEDDDEGNDDDDDEKKDGESANEGNKFSKRAAKKWKKELLAKMDEYYKLDAEVGLTLFTSLFCK